MSAWTPVTPALAPWQYQILCELASYGPQTGGEIAETPFLRRFEWSPRTAGVKLKAIQNHTGFVVRDADGFWRLTDLGRDWLNA